MLGGIQRFGAIGNKPFLDRGTVRRGGFRGSIFEFAFEREKLLWHIFRAESEALAEAPRKKACKGKSREERDGSEDLNVQVIRSYSWAAAESPKKLVV